MPQDVTIRQKSQSPLLGSMYGRLCSLPWRWMGQESDLKMKEDIKRIAAIARRHFQLTRVGTVEPIVVELGPAHPDPADIHTVRCSVTVLRESGPAVRYAHGVDSVQALLNGLHLMRTQAEALKMEGVLECDGERWTGAWWPDDHPAP